MSSESVLKVFTVEGITGFKRENGVLQFQVKWSGYHPFQSTWEKLSNMRNSKELVIEYLKDNDVPHLASYVRKYFAPSKKVKRDTQKTPVQTSASRTTISKPEPKNGRKSSILKQRNCNNPNSTSIPKKKKTF